MLDDIKASKLVNQDVVSNSIRYMNLLKNKSIEFDDEFASMEFLTKYGVDVFNRYATFLKQKLHRSVTSTEIIDLFYFDAKVRKEVSNALELFELSFKQALSYVVNKNIMYFYEEYVGNKKEVFAQSKDGEIIDQSPIKRILKKCINKLKEENPNSNRFSVFEIVNKATFGDINNWYDKLDDIQKKEIDQYLYRGILKWKDTISSDKMLKLYKGFRNQAAHSKPIFNYYNSEIAVSFKGIMINGENVMLDEKQYKCGIGMLVIFSATLFNHDVHDFLCDGLYYAFMNYLSKYPNMSDIIFHAMGLDTLVIVDNKLLLDDRFKKFGPFSVKSEM